MDGESSNQIAATRLLNEHTQALKQLKGFQKHYRIPQTASRGDSQFLAEFTESELDADLQEKFSALRSAFNLKRKQISVSGPSEGGGMIETPYFNYEITIAFLENDPSKVVWRRSISGIREPNQISSPEFVQVFGKQFSILEISITNGLDLEAIVDHIEDAESDTVTVDYDKDVTWCEIQVTESDASVRLDSDSVRVVSRAEVTPHELLAAFVTVQQQFINTLNCSSSPFLRERD